MSRAICGSIARLSICLIQNQFNDIFPTGDDSSRPDAVPLLFHRLKWCLESGIIAPRVNFLILH